MDTLTGLDPSNAIRSAAENQYQQARVRLEQAQAERTAAVCRFLEAQAQWKMTACPDTRGDLAPAGETRDSPDPLAQAEQDLHQAKSLYCAVLEQKRSVQWMLNQSRNAYLRAQERLERIAMGENETH